MAIELETGERSAIAEAHEELVKGLFRTFEMSQDDEGAFNKFHNGLARARKARDEVLGYGRGEEKVGSQDD